MARNGNNYKVVLLTILTLSVFVIAIVELTGVSRSSLFHRNHNGTFFSKDGEVYTGEIYPHETKTRDQIAAEMAKTTMQFYETKFNFGIVSEGKVVKHAFKFKNTGDNPLMIAKTDVTCGCTVTDFPTENIAPQGEGEITVEYNSTGKSGYQQKNIIVHSNALPEAVSIGIEADVR